MTLNHTVQKILDINHNRQRLSFRDDPHQQYQALNEELKVLNKIAAQQARLVRYYEDSLTQRGEPSFEGFFPGQAAG